MQTEDFYDAGCVLFVHHSHESAGWNRCFHALCFTIEYFTVAASQCTARVDGIKGFFALKDDSSLKEHGITLDYGRVKNPNKNLVIEKGIQELEREFLTAAPEGQELSQTALDTCLRRLKSRIRHSGLFAKEMILSLIHISSPRD